MSKIIDPRSDDGDYIVLKGGHKTHDPRLGRIPQTDIRNLNFDVRKTNIVVQHDTPRSYTWRCLIWLDQGNLGSCVGNAWAHELAARPKEVQGIDQQYAVDLYHAAQKLDEWPGEAYEGTSTLGGAKATMATGKIGGYHWCTDIEAVKIVVSWRKPVVVGANWYASMFTPDVAGLVKIGGGIAGGHEWLVRGYSIVTDLFLCRNSWGLSYGISGDFYISAKDLDRLLFAEGGDCCVPDLMVL